MGAGASVDEGVTVDGELAKVLSASDVTWPRLPTSSTAT